MPPKAAKRKAKAAASDDDDLWGAPAGPLRKRTRLSATHADEGSDDAARKPSKQSPSWADWQRKFNDKEKDDKRQFAAAFKQNVEKKREGILKLISESTKSLDNAGKKQAELFKQACAEIDPIAETTSKTKKGAHKTAQDSPLFQAGQGLFKKCRELVAVHEQVNGKAAAQVTTHTKEQRALWKADMEQAQQLMDYGAQYGEKVVQCNIDMSSRDENKMQLLTPPKEVLNGPGQMALEMHQKSVEALIQGGGPTWGEEALVLLDKFVGIAGLCDLEAE